MADKSVADQKLFISLIRTAQDDPAIRKRIRAMLEQPVFHRKSMLNTLIAELRMQSAPGEFIQALACLLDDEVAAKAREPLDKS